MAETRMLKKKFHSEFAVCYLPPMSSSREVDVYEKLSQLEELVEKLADLGTVVVCDDFNSRCDSFEGCCW